MQHLSWQIEKIINVANELQQHGSTAASSAEQIAAAFVLNKPEYLPADYPDLVEAWDRLGNWQSFVREIKQQHMHRITEAE